MRRPVVPGWAKEQTPTPFFVSRKTKIIEYFAESGVLISET
jgi:hypothetical protein